MPGFADQREEACSGTRRRVRVRRSGEDESRQTAEENADQEHDDVGRGLFTAEQVHELAERDASDHGGDSGESGAAAPEGGAFAARHEFAQPGEVDRGRQLRKGLDQRVERDEQREGRRGGQPEPDGDQSRQREVERIGRDRAEEPETFAVKTAALQVCADDLHGREQQRQRHHDADLRVGQVNRPQQPGENRTRADRREEAEQHRRQDREIHSAPHDAR